MNKVQNINLGGVHFIMNDDAYKKLNEYLNAVSNHFAGSSGQDEIIQDIEIRMAEIFHEHLQGKTIVDMDVLDKAIERLGRPEQFEADEEYATAEESEDKSRTSYEDNTRQEKAYRYSVGKKLFRDPDNQVIAGVCGGLSAYFGINDPVWLRILFVLLLFAGFSSGILYIILWIIMPKARTASDRLAMRGEEINIRSIGNKIEEEINDLGKKFEDMSSDWKKK